MGKPCPVKYRSAIGPNAMLPQRREKSPVVGQFVKINTAIETVLMRAVRHSMQSTWVNWMPHYSVRIVGHPADLKSTTMIMPNR